MKKKVKTIEIDVKVPTYTCCLCGLTMKGYGNNPAPLVEIDGARCCDMCNSLKVIPYRIMLIQKVFLKNKL